MDTDQKMQNADLLIFIGVNRCPIGGWIFFLGVLGVLGAAHWPYVAFTRADCFRGRSVSPMQRLTSVAGSSRGKKERWAVAK